MTGFDVTREKLTPPLLSVPKRLMSEVMRPERKTLFMAECLSQFRQRADPAGMDNRESPGLRSEEHTSELQSLMRISYAVFCLKKKTQTHKKTKTCTILITN